jgi:uncharacterized protein (DUF486 family)
MKKLTIFGAILLQSYALKRVLVPALIFASGGIMAAAWLGHLRWKSSIGFWAALLASWCLVLPEYALNVFATRWGYGLFSGAQMAAIHLASGVLCVALVSRFVLGEELTFRHAAGFSFLAVGMVLLLWKEGR